VWLGGAFVAAAIVGGLLWWFPNDPVAAGGSVESAAATHAAALEGFREDAWYLPDDELFGFVEIAAGPFAMGSDVAKDPMAYENERWSREQPHGSIDLDAFYIGRYEVTVAQFRAFADATGYPVERDALAAPASHPVTSISWPDAVAYCRWLERELRASSKTPSALRQRLGEGWRVSLPTEAEWEKAARGGDGRIFPWGNQPLEERANFGARATAAVGGFPCGDCAFGLADMSGNVWEWTRSPYQPYPYDEADDGDDLDVEALWVMRGGSFADPVRNVRAAVRGAADPGVHRPFIGFRVVLSRF
jgi:formylglycine-generating enzyme required for sulfatase activity